MQIITQGITYLKSHKILKNTISLGTGQILTKLVSLISIPIIARKLGVTSFGEYTLVFGFVMLFGGLSDWGIHLLTVREVAKNKDTTIKYFTNTLILRLALGLLFYLLMILAASLLHYSKEITNLIIIFGPIIFANSMINTLIAILNAKEKMDFSAGLLFAQSLLIPIIVIPLLYLDISLKKIFLILIFVNLALALFLIRYLSKKFFLFNFKHLNLEIWREILKESWAYALMAIIWMVYINNGAIILSKTNNLTDVGLYNSSLKLILALLFIPGSIMTAFFPALSRQITEQNKEKIKINCERLIKILLWLVLPLAIFIFIFSGSIIKILYGQIFLDSATILRFLSVVLVFLFINSPLGYIILSSGRIKNYVPFEIFITMINVSLGIIFSLRYNYLGPVYAILTTEIMIFFFRLFFIKKFLLFKINWNNILSFRLKINKQE